MTEELKVVLRRNEHSGFGFSLLGTTGPPHVIYDIVENSPAADCGAVEAGDIILKVNGTDVHRYTTKEVLKCLRLSDDLVTLDLRRDPQLKAHIKEQLANTQSPHYADIESQNIYDYKSLYQNSRHSPPQHSTYDTHNSVDHVSCSSNSPAQRYKSPTHLPNRPPGASNTGSTSANHSRSSSASSAQIQIVETTAGPVNTAATCTSPTCRPSRIPTALKCPQKPTPQQSPQHKRPRPSQIPTKAALAAAAASASTSTNGNGNATAATSTSGGNVGTPLQHSNSYSGSGLRQQQPWKERDPDPISAPPQPAKAPRFEAYMMTGDLILNLSRTQQSSNLLPGHAKKVDSLRDSPIRAPTTTRANGAALAPRASGESSPTSSSSVESPLHATNYDRQQQRDKTKRNSSRQQQQQQHLLQQQRDSINNSYNNSNSGGERHNRKDSLTNDTLLLCEELEQDDEDEAEDIFEEEDVEDDLELELDNNCRRQRQQRQQQQQRYQRRPQQRHYEQYRNEHEDEEDELEENEEDQTHYDITNIETYNSGGIGGESSDRQCLMMHYGAGDNEGHEEEDYGNNSLASASARQRLRALKQQKLVALKNKRAGAGDFVDCGRHGSGSVGVGGGSSSSSATVKSDGIGANTSQDETSFSVPTSPISLSTPLLDKETANSVPTSPEPSSLGAAGMGVGGLAADGAGVVRRHNGIVRKCDSAGFRTSKSEDHLQQVQREGIAAVIPIDIDEDVNSSLNTLLDTRQDSEDSQASDRDRIVWTYNAPLLPHQLQQQQQQQQHHQYSSHYGHSSSPNSHSHSHSSSISSSPQHSAGSPASPTSVSSSVMSSSGSKGALGVAGSSAYNGGQQQLAQQQQQQLLNYNVSDAAAQRQQQQAQQKQQQKSEHKLVIQVRGIDSSNSTSPRSLNSEQKDSEDELATLTEEPSNTVLAASSGVGGGNSCTGDGRDYSPPVSDDGSDVESLHSYHYSPKAVDMPSAIRLAKRLYSLDGFKKSDVSRHLSKNNDFSRAVADEYLKYFSFEKNTLDQSLREFLQQFALSGETQERERVLVHFSKRFLDCNPGSFNSQDAVHTLTCAIMLLNTDLHGQNIGRKMTCAEFIENLAELNDGENFPKDVLKYLYQAIKSQPLEWALDDDTADLQKQLTDNNTGTATGSLVVGQNPFLDLPESSTAVEFKKGYVMRKCCYESNYKKTPFGKRSWKMFYCTLRDLVLFLHKDEHGFRKSQMSDNLHNAIRIHHALATKATDYTKKQHVFRLQTADQAEYLFQTSDSKELQSWVETINFVCAAYSAPPLEGGVGSQKRFQRPLLPSTHTKFLMKEQLDAHELQLAQLENTVMEHKKGPVPSKGLPLQNYKEKESYLQHELRRYKAYVSILSAKLLADQQQLELQQLTSDEESDTFPLGGAGQRLQPLALSQPQVQQPTPTNSIIAQQQQQPQQSTNRLWLCGCCGADWWRNFFTKVY